MGIYLSWYIPICFISENLYTSATVYCRDN
nr:MAG TPA: hypothetical protein [Caudoviricetes sp.]DAN95776.1 MAG TPA: hypothetical protein [Caudoviricetes sp.]